MKSLRMSFLIVGLLGAASFSSWAVIKQMRPTVFGKIHKIIPLTAETDTVPLPDAAVYFLSKKQKSDTILVFSDPQGRFALYKPVSGEYRVEIRYAGEKRKILPNDSLVVHLQKNMTTKLPDIFVPASH